MEKVWMPLSPMLDNPVLNPLLPIREGEEGGCLSCGTECLSSVQSAVPVCIAAGFEYTQGTYLLVNLQNQSILKNCLTLIFSSGWMCGQASGLGHGLPDLHQESCLLCH